MTDCPEWRWQMIPAGQNGERVGVLTDGESVYGWVRSRTGAVWQAVRPPEVIPEGPVNLGTGGVLLGVFPTPQIAMNSVMKLAKSLFC